MKKILFVIPSLGAGGAERVALTYIRELPSAFYAVVLVTFDDKNDLEHLLPENVRHLKLGTIKTQKSLLALRSLIKRERPYFVYTTHSRTATLVALTKCFTGRPNFYHIARVPNMPSAELIYGYTSKMMSLAYKLGFRLADKVLAQTEDMKNDVISLYGVSPSKIVTAHNPVDKAFVRKSADEINSPLCKDVINLVASGSHKSAKGFDILIEAMSKVVKSRSDVKLSIIGRFTEDTEMLKKQIGDLELQNHVELLGFKDNPYPYYKACDAFVLSSRWEGFPNVLLENKILGTPLVATTCIPIINALISEGENGFLAGVNDSDALALAICNSLNLSRSKILANHRNAYSHKSLDYFLSEIN